MPAKQLAIPNPGQFDIMRIAQAHWANGLNRNLDDDGQCDVLLGCGTGVEDTKQISATRTDMASACEDS